MKLLFKTQAEATPAELRSIAATFVEDIDDQGESWGWCRCPAIDLHKNANARTDCKIVWARTTLSDGAEIVPGIYCYHGSCEAERDARALELRRALGRRQPSQASSPRPISSPTIFRRPKLTFDPARLEKVARRLPPITADFLESISPVVIRDLSPVGFLHALFRDGEKVLIFNNYRSQGQELWTHPGELCNTDQLERFTKRERVGVWFLSNPVCGEYLPNDSGNQSRRSWQNVTSWRYLLLESDEADPDHWLGAVAQLSLPIAALTTSGGRSIHALVRLDAGSRKEVRDIVEAMKPVLIPLGADAGSFKPVQLTRLPNCERLGKENKEGKYVKFPAPQLQRLLYLNPNPNNTPLCEMPLAPAFYWRLNQ